ncbi:hypothetical protein [Sporosarcina sp. G11-34]|uniref:hypothetical protein n=1 Tax=Sporosarcina sp. G11-34 TaxID=2849605 RepID=UPI0022A9D6A7|nr:hypothetical protein [Sporosarcina sp. G11-34]MCZ2260837.1 FAD-binding domain-containing protein [Sporosarcina sp. G11-34]
MKFNYIEKNVRSQSIHMTITFFGVKTIIVLRETYPLPIVDHSIARKRALEAYGKVENS